MAFEHTVLVTAGGGHIGQKLVPKLLSSNNIKVVLPTSNASRLQSGLPSSATPSNAAVEEGSIANPQWIQDIITKHNVDVVFLCLTGTDELMTTLNFLDAMQRAGTVKQLVYLSACGDMLDFKSAMQACSAAHALVKTTLEQKLAYGRFEWKTTILGPTLFYDNDFRSKKSMLEHGLFDEPLGEIGVSRVSTSDIALAAHNAILNPEKWSAQPPKKIMIGSLQKFTGSEIASLWSEAIGKEVKMWPTDDQGLLQLETEFVKKLQGSGRGWEWARDLRLMYEMFIKLGFGMSEEEYAVQVELLGKEAEDYVAWVKETGRKWRE